MGPPHEGSIRRPIAPWANALPLSYVPLLYKCRLCCIYIYMCVYVCMYWCIDVCIYVCMYVLFPRVQHTASLNKSATSACTETQWPSATAPRGLSSPSMWTSAWKTFVAASLKRTTMPWTSSDTEVTATAPSPTASRPGFSIVCNKRYYSAVRSLYTTAKKCLTNKSLKYINFEFWVLFVGFFYYNFSSSFS